MAKTRDYELGLVISPDAGDEQARAIVERVSQVVRNNDGQVVRVNAWGRRRLAYPIEHHRDGLYFFFDLIMPPAAVTEIERALHVNENIIRHLMKLRDSRVVGQEREHAAEADRQAEARARTEAEQQAQAAAERPAEEPAPAPAAPAPAEAQPETQAVQQPETRARAEPETPTVATTTAEAEA